MFGTPNLIITFLFLALLLFPAPLISQATGTGLPFSSCRSNSDCQAPLRCLSPLRNTPCTQTLVSCLCQLRSLRVTTCTFTSDCPAPLVCAQSEGFSSVCVARSAIREISIFAPLPRLLPPPTKPLAFDQCQVNSDCASGFICTSNPGSTSSCPAGSPTCACTRRNGDVQFCFANDDCRAGEVCVNSVLSGLPICASRLAANRFIGFREIVYPNPRGLSLDPCNSDSDCASTGICLNVINPSGISLCNGSLGCLCLRPVVDTCSRVADCGVSGEVCATASGVLEGAECVSIGARDAFDFVRQVDSNDTCPVLINRDLPATVSTARILNQNSSPSKLIRRKLDSQLTARFAAHERMRGDHSFVAKQMESVKILGGLRASGNLRPFMVLVVFGDSLCSGVLIGRRWVLSAAHCQISPGALVLTGEAVVFFPIPSSVSRSAIRVRRVFQPPQFSFEEQNVFDIAVVELSADAPEGAKFMRVNTRLGLPGRGKPVRAVGYGRTNEDDMSQMSALRQVDLRAISTAECQESGNFQVVPTTVRPALHLCVRIARERCGICDGDSGGPLIIYQRDEPLLVGISSSSSGCDTVSFPAIFSRVSGLISFLRSTPAQFRTETDVGINSGPPCAAGEFLLIASRICIPCPVDQVSRGGRATRCRPCPRGFRRDSVDGSQCSCRGENAVGRGIMMRSCRRCAAGFFSGIDSTTCRRCRAGTTSMPGAASCA